MLVLAPAMFCYVSLSGQNYKQMMEDPQYNVYDVIDAAEKHFETHSKGKGSGYKGYQRWKSRMEPRFHPSGDRSHIDARHVMDEYAGFKAQSAEQRTAGTGECWTYRGPDYAYNHFPTDWAPGVGRIEAVWANAATLDTIYCGSRSGGFWKSYDGGANWRPTTQDLPAVGVFDIEVHPERPNEIYIVSRHATTLTLGILKSTDYGETWNTTSLAFQYTNFVRGRELAIPVKDTFYHATSQGLYRSVDDGATWTNVRSGNITKLVVHPTNSQKLYLIDAASSNNIYRSVDGGSTWANTWIANNNTPYIAVSAAQPDWVYFVSSGGVWRSTDGGLNFNFRGQQPTGSGVMTMGVSDTDADRVFVGSLNQYSSTDGGQTWTLFADWVNYGSNNYVHADGRRVESWNGVVYMCTDGYLGRSTNNGDTWTRVNESGTGVREFYRIGCSPADIEVCTGGSQDNGTSVMLQGDWWEWIGADGMEAHVDRNNADVWFGTIQFGAIRRTTMAGQNADNIAPTPTNGDWITPSVIDPCNDNTMFICYDTLFKTNDNGDSWQAVYGSWAAGNMHRLAIAPSDSNYLYVSRSARIWRSSDNGNSWLEVSAGLPGSSITRIAVTPNDPQSLVVSLSGYNNGEKVFRSANGGSTWINISDNLPNLPANVVAFEESPDQRVYVGMDVGVYYKPLLGTTWTLYQDSLPAVEVTDMEILQGANTVRISTWGRGMWEAPFPGKADAPRITKVDISPKPTNSFPNSNDTVHVDAVIVDADGISTATLAWGLDGVNFPNTIAMNPAAGISTFSTSTPIPAHPTGTNVYFRITATDNNSEVTQSEKLMYKTKVAIPCDAAGAQGTSFDFIDSVGIASLSHQSVQDYYGDFRNLYYPHVFLDSTYDLAVGVNYAFAQDSMFAWIDWNKNASFTDPGEQVIMSAFDGNFVSRGAVTVPSGAVLDTVVMRVRVIFDPNPIADPCDDYFGEVEDYSLVVWQDPMTGVSAPVNGDLVVQPNPTDGMLEVTLPEEMLSAEVGLFDLTGRKLNVPALRNGPYGVVLNLEGLADGVYVVEVKEGEVRRTRKVILQR
ncbi:MAG: GEVED domain-containing protein [Bacteroidota bacterium]